MTAARNCTRREGSWTILSEALAPVAGCKTELVQSNLDMVYRTYPEFIKKNNLPGEIFVKFSKRSTRDMILKVTTGITLKIQGEEMEVLKVPFEVKIQGEETEVPFEVKKRRKQYKNLTSFLQKNSTPYRWIIPEGLIFNFKEKKEMIDFVLKAKAFLQQHQSSVKEKGKGKLEGNIVTEDVSEHGSRSSDSSSSSSLEEVFDSESELGAAAPESFKVKLPFDQNKCGGKKAAK